MAWNHQNQAFEQANAEWSKTHNTDGSLRMPWQGGPAILPDDPIYVCLPGTGTVFRALNASADGQTARTLAIDPTTSQPFLSEIAKYNTDEQIEAERAAGRVLVAAGQPYPGATVPLPAETEAAVEAVEGSSASGQPPPHQSPLK